jgi:hypothetical protein
MSQSTTANTSHSSLSANATYEQAYSMLFSTRPKSTGGDDGLEEPDNPSLAILASREPENPGLRLYHPGLCTQVC